MCKIVAIVLIVVPFLWWNRHEMATLFQNTRESTDWKGFAEAKAQGVIWRLNYSGRYCGGRPLFFWHSMMTSGYMKNWGVDGGIDTTTDVAGEKTFDSTREAVEQMKRYGKPAWIREYWHYGLGGEDSHEDSVDWVSLAAFLIGSFLLAWCVILK